MSDWRHEMPLTLQEVARLDDARRLLGPPKVRGRAKPSEPRTSVNTATIVGPVRFVVTNARQRWLAA
jgi:hypothetical protein